MANKYAPIPEALRGIDCEIAEKIFGYKWVTGAGLEHSSMVSPADHERLLRDLPMLYQDGKLRPPDFSALLAVPHFASEMGDAWKVVEAILAKEPRAGISVQAGRYDLYAGAAICHITLVGGGRRWDHQIMQATAPLAICEAARWWVQWRREHPKGQQGEQREEAPDGDQTGQ